MGVCAGGVGVVLNPKAETRRPKEIRNPKSEVQNPPAEICAMAVTEMTVVKMLSTVKRIAWERVDGEVVGEMVRVKGRCLMVGRRPVHRPYYQVVEYFDGRGVDRSLIV